MVESDIVIGVGGGWLMKRKKAKGWEMSWL